ncbi:MAG: N-acetyl-gamma-glutamyl-phosphate reductase [Planctomycetes bacterium]|nr:N-acetyl-gamma-glutamyl-phosphate reductase [Planctomycetota bacterium]
MQRKIGVGIIGGSGYIGAEILRYLAVHPQVEVRWVTANTKAGEEVGALLPNLRGYFNLRFLPMEGLPADLGGAAAVFVALPHNQSQEVIPDLASRFPEVRFIDMGGDFRTPDPEGYKKYYGEAHAAPQWLERFVYGFTEFQRPRIASARFIANPGCFATSLLLALAPLARAEKLRGSVFATGVTGSSGAGNAPAQTTHHPERAANFRSYKPLAHQHLLEVNGFLRALTSAPFQLHFVPQSGPFVRGLFTTVFAPGLGLADLEAVYREAFGKEPLIAIDQGSPDLRWVQGTPRSHIGLAAEKDQGVVFVAMDNLGKGAAGQAIQNLNCMFGMEETTGLMLPGGFV